MSVTDVEDIRRELDAGNLIKAYDPLQSAVAAGTQDPRVRYLFVLVLARLGIADRALSAYETLNIAAIGSVEAKALHARLLKDRALALAGPGRTAALSIAAEGYRSIYEETGNLYPAINAASLFFLAGRTVEARELSRAILDAEAVAAPDYYDLATRAEAQVVLQDYPAASDTLVAASRARGATVGARAGTHRHLRLLLEHHKASPEEAGAVLSKLATGVSVFFSGRMFRENPAAEDALREQLKDTIADRRIVSAFGSLRCGSDIVIAEELLARGVPLVIALESPRDSFVETRVLAGGSGWEKRFRACLGAATEVHIVSDTFHADDPLASALSARVAAGMARRFADQNVCELLGLFVLPGTGDQADRTDVDPEEWRAAGRQASIIRLDGVEHPTAARRKPPEPAPQFRRREVSLLFADFVGFSALSDAALPALVGTALREMAEVLGDDAARVLFRNTWGDACFAVFAGPVFAVDAATRLLARLRAGGSLDVLGGLRISLHHGIAMEMFDPVLGRLNYFGLEVSRAARIEPITPPNCIYASETFVNAAASDSAVSLRAEYVGRVQLPKNFGEERLYLLGT